MSTIDTYVEAVKPSTSGLDGLQRIFRLYPELSDRLDNHQSGLADLADQLGDVIVNAVARRGWGGMADVLELIEEWKADV